MGTATFDQAAAEAFAGRLLVDASSDLAKNRTHPLGGFTQVDIRNVEGDIFNAYYIARP